MNSQLIFIILLLSLISDLSAESPAPLPEATIRTRLEVLSRIPDSLYQSSPRVKALVDETATALQKDPRLIDLVAKFALTNHSEAILEIARNEEATQIQDKAITFLLSRQNSVDSPNLSDRKLLPLLARNGSLEAISLLMPILREGDQKQVDRSQLIRTLCAKKNSATRLLQHLEQANTTKDRDIAQIAAKAMRQTPWDELRMRFESLNPNTTQASNEPQSLDISELMTRVGTPSSGRVVFRSPEFSCVNCHVAEGVGKDIGPGLSEIGKKLGKDALYDAILNPSSGISFDYEGWNLTLNSGDELTGIVLSRTETHWTLKNLLGQIQEIPLSEVFEKQKMSTSLMPNGLGLLLGEEKLVDLVSYLSTLGK